MKPLAPKSHPRSSSRPAWGLWMAALYAVLFLNGAYAWADEYMVLVNEEKSHLELGYDPVWSPEDYMNAKETGPAQWDESSALETMLYQGTEGNADENLPKEGKGMAPSGNSKTDLNRRIHPPLGNPNGTKTQRLTENSHFDKNTVAPKSFPYLPFTSSLVNLLALAVGANSENLPLAIQQRTDTFYPYSTVGRLFYKKSDGSSWACSAAVIGQRLVVTSALCLHSGIGGESGWNKDFNFVPSYLQGSAPYGTWVWSKAWVGIEWYNSGGNVPNQTEYGILVMQDQNGSKIGENTGHLGWRIKTVTFDPCQEHIHLLGYPSTVGGVSTEPAREMHQITGKGSNLPSYPNICILGTNWGAGSIGGPWVWKFGWRLDTNGNRVINQNSIFTLFTTKFTDNAYPGVIFKGGSVFDTRWSEFYQNICNDAPGNCTN